MNSEFITESSLPWLKSKKRIFKKIYIIIKFNTNMLQNVVFAGTASPPTHWSFLQVPSVANYCDTKISRQPFLKEDNMNQRKKREFKSDHYSLCNRENEKHIFAGGPVREEGNASLVEEVTSVRVHPPANSFSRLQRL